MRLLSGQSQTAADVKKADARKRRQAKDETPAIPPELLLRRDHNIRYERNGAVFATDGKVGALRKIVVDEARGEVSDLVVAVDGSDRVVLLPPDLVDKTAGSAVFLVINRAQFSERAAGAPVFEKRRFGKADVKALAKHAKGATGNARRSIANAGKDFVETPTVSPLERLQRKPDALAAD